MRLLLVEDTPDVAEAIAVSFARAGDTLDCAGDLMQARASLSLQQYDVLILDINLPDGSGRDLLRTAPRAQRHSGSDAYRQVRYRGARRIT